MDQHDLTVLGSFGGAFLGIFVLFLFNKKARERNPNVVLRVVLLFFLSAFLAAAFTQLLHKDFVQTIAKLIQKFTT